MATFHQSARGTPTEAVLGQADWWKGFAAPLVKIVLARELTS